MQSTEETPKGFNCLTQGIHHGRPEELWNIPLTLAVVIFQRDSLQAIVINRIYNDAMEFVGVHEQRGTGETVTIEREWADAVTARAKDMYLSTLQHKIGEINRYYHSHGWQLEQDDMVKLTKENTLNSNYRPLHSHDTINMFCRILGTSAARYVARKGE